MHRVYTPNISKRVPGRLKEQDFMWLCGRFACIQRLFHFVDANPRTGTSARRSDVLQGYRQREAVAPGRPQRCGQHALYHLLTGVRRAQNLSLAVYSIMGSACRTLLTSTRNAVQPEVVAASDASAAPIYSTHPQFVCPRAHFDFQCNSFQHGQERQRKGILFLAAALS